MTVIQSVVTTGPWYQVVKFPPVSESTAVGEAEVFEVVHVDFFPEDRPGYPADLAGDAEPFAAGGGCGNFGAELLAEAAVEFLAEGGGDVLAEVRVLDLRERASPPEGGVEARCGHDGVGCAGVGPGEGKDPRGPSSNDGREVRVYVVLSGPSAAAVVAGKVVADGEDG